MDLLGGYSSGSDGEPDSPVQGSGAAQQAARPAPDRAAAVAAPGPAPPVLFNPFADNAGPPPRGAFTTAAAAAAAAAAPSAKRPASQMTGSSLAQRSAAGPVNGSGAASGKAAKTAAAGKPSGTGGASGGHMIPPQLRGRANVVTEDLDKMGLRRAAGGGGGSTGGRGGGRGAPA